MPEIRGEIEKETVTTGSSSERDLSPARSKRGRDHQGMILSLVTTHAQDIYSKGGSASDPCANLGENIIDSQLGKRRKCASNMQLEGNAETNERLLEVGANFFGKKGLCMLEVGEDTPFLCKFCNVRCTSKKDFDTHCAGKKHRNVVKGETGPRLSKLPKRGAAGSKAKEAPSQIPEGVSTKQQATVDAITTNIDRAGSLSSCEGGTDIETLKTHAVQAPHLISGKNSSVKQEDCKAHNPAECPGAHVSKNGSICGIAVYDHENCNFDLDIAAVNGTEFEDKSILDVARRKSRSDTIARALVAAYKACACPGLESLLKPGPRVQEAGHEVSQAAAGGMVTMHTDCFMNLLHDVQVKGMEGLVLHVMREGRLKGFLGESTLSNLLSTSGLSPVEKGQDLSCMICRVEYGSKSDVDRHVTGKKHISLVSRMHSRCQVCNVNCNSEKEYEKHVSGKKHASKLRLAQKRGTL